MSDPKTFDTRKEAAEEITKMVGWSPKIEKNWEGKYVISCGEEIYLDEDGYVK